MGRKRLYPTTRTRIQRNTRCSRPQRHTPSVLSFVNHFDLECDQVDIVSAFLNGEIEETLYVHPPELSDIPAGKVLRLKKSLYGTKQAPRCFNRLLDERTGRQTHACISDARGGNLIILTVHVDDQLIASTNRAALNEFKRQLNHQFECKDMGPAKHFLGFDIYRDRPNRKLYIFQERYLQEVLDRFDLGNCNAVKTPFPSGFRPVEATNAEHELAKHHPYRQIVGSILYASLRYIKGTLDLCLRFDGKSAEQTLLGHVDADWGGDLDTRRSTTGYIFQVYGGVVAWKSRRQPTVALSTTEAEYMASADATRQAIRLPTWALTSTTLCLF